MGYIKRVRQIIVTRKWSVLCGTILMELLMGCATGKEAGQNHKAPFELVWAESQPWVSGISEGPSGTHLSFELSPPSTTVRFKALCYMNQSADLINRPNRPDEFRARFVRASLSSDAASRVCFIPDSWQKPANDPDQAVLTYEQDGVEYYYVLQDIVHKPLLAYPEKQQPN